MEFIICPECGAENKLEAVNCESCGADITAVKSLIDNANEHYNEALALAHAGKLDEAIGQVEAALSMNAQNTNYHNLLGTLYAQKGLFSEAIHAWERCLAIDPEMEKAYHNIEKAHDMEEEYAEEQTRRPFLLATIGSGVAAAVLLVVTLYLGISLYFKSNQVDDLQTQISGLSSNVAKYKNEVESFNKVFPEGGVTGLLTEMEKLRTQLAEKDKQMQASKDQYELVLQRRQEQMQRTSTQIAELNNKLKEKDLELQQLKNLESVINTNNRKIASLENELQKSKEQLQLEVERVADLREKLKLAQETSNSIRDDKERAIANLKTAHENMIETKMQEIRERREEISQLQQKIDEMQYASLMVVEALKNINNGQFELAQTNIQNAQKRSPQLPVVQYVHEEIQEIMTSPLEIARRYEAARMREDREAQQSLEYVKRYLARAEDALDDGKFDDAAYMAELAVNITESESLDDSLKEKGQILFKQAQNEKTKLLTMMQTAKQHIQNQELKEAEKLLRDVLKKSPGHAEAQTLLNQITAEAS